ncbi:CsbD family protein [Streptomyces sp. ISL-36]|uniref:CsbD family protein n=1 Tax=Streptomyces sp. ISL-36 TaxID=2819182 RepID=UPI001BEBBF1B|nr:CsbD family protein [Streptomyces sp. ISL-36]MBT2444322.1 CsbD family protein [Streptomyces sp. ISL-36]
MGKAKAKMEQMKGKAKERVGDATDDRSMEAEGRREKTVGKVREAAGDTVEGIKKGRKK